MSAFRLVGWGGVSAGGGENFTVFVEQCGACCGNQELCRTCSLQRFFARQFFLVAAISSQSAGRGQAWRARQVTASWQSTLPPPLPFPSLPKCIFASGENTPAKPATNARTHTHTHTHAHLNANPHMCTHADTHTQVGCFVPCNAPCVLPSGYSSVGRASDCRAMQLSDGPWFDSGWPDFAGSSARERKEEGWHSVLGSLCPACQAAGTANETSVPTTSWARAQAARHCGFSHTMCFHSSVG